jgi:two-component system, OmpR family, phosphate regulon response regulator PhoB
LLRYIPVRGIDNMKNILIIEDESDLAELVAFNLEKEGYRPLIAPDGPSGLEAVRNHSPDLILLDLMLPGMSGMEICKVLKGRDKTAGIPVIMLTAKGEEIDRVVGFEVGADDYVIKPFSPRELLLRIKAVLRRAGSEEAASRIIKVGPISIDTDRHIVSVDDNHVVLTTTEFKLLFNLADRLGRVQSRDRLLKDVWGMSHIGDTRTVDTHITRLRSKLGEAGDMIQTVRGFGYKMDRE